MDVEVGGPNGKETIELKGVLYMPSLPFNIYSLIIARKLDLYYDCKKVLGKIILQEDKVDGSVRQVAIFTETAGRWTLDCKVVNNIEQRDTNEAASLVAEQEAVILQIKTGQSVVKAVNIIEQSDFNEAVNLVTQQKAVNLQVSTNGLYAQKVAAKRVFWEENLHLIMDELQRKTNSVVLQFKAFDNLRRVTIFECFDVSKTALATTIPRAIIGKQNIQVNAIQVHELGMINVKTMKRRLQVKINTSVGTLVDRHLEGILKDTWIPQRWCHGHISARHHRPRLHRIKRNIVQRHQLCIKAQME